MTVAKIKTEQIRIGALIERPIVAARAARTIFLTVAPTAAPPVPDGCH
jgi:hypothetical protein